MGIFDKFFGFISPAKFAPILAAFYAVVGFVFMILSFGRCKYFSFLLAGCGDGGRGFWILFCYGRNDALRSRMGSCEQEK